MCDHRFNNFVGICGCPGVKGFISIFGVGDIYFSSTYYHLQDINFVFFFGPWGDSCSTYAEIYDMPNHPDTVFIAE